MYYLEIILNLPVNQGFTYSYESSPDENEELKPQIGKRAEIMFGNKKTEGFIINILDSLPEDFPIPKEKIRPIKRIIDKEPLFGQELIEIARWISQYYLCTLGEAVFSMLPGGKRETSTAGFSFEEEITSVHKNTLSDEQKNAVEKILEVTKKSRKRIKMKKQILRHSSIIYTDQQAQAKPKFFYPLQKKFLNRIKE